MRTTFLILILFSIPATSLADRRTGARLFRQGESHYDDGEYDEALASFQRSLEAFTHPATQFNIALCLEKLGRLREADEVLAKVQNGNRRRIARKARYARARIAAAVPTLRVDPGNDGATVAVDGESCPAPCERRVDPGAHEVVVAADDGAEHRQTVDLRAGQTFQLSLERFEATEPADDEDDDESRTHRRSHDDGDAKPLLLWTGVALVAIGVAGTLYFGLSEETSTAGAVGGVGVTVLGIAIGATGLLMPDESEPKRARGLTVSGSF